MGNIRSFDVSAWVLGAATVILAGCIGREVPEAAPYVMRVPAPAATEDAAAVLARTRNAVRALPSSNRVNGVVVALDPGIWNFRSGFRLESADSGTNGAAIVWKGAPNGGTVFRFSRDLPLGACAPVSDPGARARLDPAAADRVRELDIAFLGLKKPVVTREFHLAPLPVPDLFCDGVRLPTARWPDSRADAYPGADAWTTIDRILDPGTSTSVPAAKRKGGVFTYLGDRPARWTKAPEVFLQGYWCFDWWESTILVECIDPATRTIRLRHPHISTVKRGNPSPRRWRALHLLEELDRPGEYYVDFAAKKLYLIVPDGARRLSVAATPATFLSILRTHDVEWRDVTFEEGYGGGIYGDGVRNVTLRNLRFRNLRSNAIGLYHATHCTVRTCDVEETGRGGITVSGGDRKTLARADNLIEDCRVRTFARMQMCYANGICVGGVGNTVRHCLLADAPHQALAIGGNDNLIEYNVFSNAVNNSDDAGCIYKGRNPSARGNVIRRNAFYDIGSPRGHGTAAIYFDDGDVGERVEENLFVRCGFPGKGSFGTVFSHGGFSNVVKNCVFVDCRRPIGSAPWSDKRWYKYMHEKTMLRRLKEEVDIDAPAYRAAYPDFRGFLDNPPPLARDNLALSNVVVRCETLKSGRWVTNATTVVYGDDPGFRDAARGDYSLCRDSRIFRDLPGFPSGGYERAGLLTPRK